MCSLSKRTALLVLMMKGTIRILSTFHLARLPNQSINAYLKINKCLKINACLKTSLFAVELEKSIAKQKFNDKFKDMEGVFFLRF